jgi:23S rRNA (pseudouridine1915-N3)-methyltransferase
MKIRLLAMGSRMDEWVRDGYLSYVERLPREIRLELVEVPLARRSPGTPVTTARQKEGEKLLKLLRPGEYVVALDEGGTAWSSTELADRLRGWLRSQPELALVIGGPDGLTDEVRRRAQAVWSLSALTFPHGLVRILVAEQLYRAWTILQGHPYHKA